MVRLQQEVVANDENGYGLYIYSSQFVEHTCALLKQICNRHSKGVGNWCMHVAQIQDIHVLGAIHMNLVNCASIVDKKEKNDHKIRITQDTITNDNKILTSSIVLFQQYVELVATIKFGCPIPTAVKNVMEVGNETNQNPKHDDVSWIEFVQQLIYQQHNTTSQLTQTDWDEEIDGELTNEQVQNSKQTLDVTTEIVDTSKQTNNTSQPHLLHRMTRFERMKIAQQLRTRLNQKQ